LIRIITGGVDDFHPLSPPKSPKKVDILILGEEGSAAWKYGNYGSKYEKARQLQEKGSNIIVVKEQDIIL
jgi:hypothetical protein